MCWALGVEEQSRHRSCCHGPLEARGRIPWTMSKSHRCWRPEPAAIANLAVLLLILMNSWLLSFLWVPLVEAKLVKATIGKVVTGYCQGFIELEVPGWSMPLLKGGINWFSLPLGRSPAFLTIFLKELEEWSQLLTSIFFLTQRPPKHFLSVLNYVWMIFLPFLVHPEELCFSNERLSFWRAWSTLYPWFTLTWVLKEWNYLHWFPI